MIDIIVSSRSIIVPDRPRRNFFGNMLRDFRASPLGMFMSSGEKLIKTTGKKICKADGKKGIDDGSGASCGPPCTGPCCPAGGSYTGYIYYYSMLDCCGNVLGVIASNSTLFGQYISNETTFIIGSQVDGPGCIDSATIAPYTGECDYCTIQGRCGVSMTSCTVTISNFYCGVSCADYVGCQSNPCDLSLLSPEIDGTYNMTQAAGCGYYAAYYTTFSQTYPCWTGLGCVTPTYPGSTSFNFYVDLTAAEAPNCGKYALQINGINGAWGGGASTGPGEWSGSEFTTELKYVDCAGLRDGTNLGLEYLDVPDCTGFRAERTANFFVSFS